jgi:hypothetical protein
MWSAIGLLAAGMTLVLAARHLIGRWLGRDPDEPWLDRSEVRVQLRMRDVAAFFPQAGPIVRIRRLLPGERAEREAQDGPRSTR